MLSLILNGPPWRSLCIWYARHVILLATTCLINRKDQTSSATVIPILLESDPSHACHYFSRSLMPRALCLCWQVRLDSLQLLLSRVSCVYAGSHPDWFWPHCNWIVRLLLPALNTLLTLAALPPSPKLPALATMAADAFLVSVDRFFYNPEIYFDLFLFWLYLIMHALILFH